MNTLDDYLNDLSPNYRAALERARAATATMSKVRVQYRARQIGDDEFFAALALEKAAEADFDAAFSREAQSRPVPMMDLIRTA